MAGNENDPPADESRIPLVTRVLVGAFLLACVLFFLILWLSSFFAS